MSLRALLNRTRAAAPAAARPDAGGQRAQRGGRRRRRAPPAAADPPAAAPPAGPPRNDDGTQGPIHCERCAASCCRLEVLLLADDGVPAHLTATDRWGGTVMRRLDDGWCAALNRGTLRCSIYARRPWVCRALEMGGDDCRQIRAEDGYG